VIGGLKVKVKVKVGRNKMAGAARPVGHTNSPHRFVELFDEITKENIERCGLEQVGLKY
jgi:hypothetical protein